MLRSIVGSIGAALWLTTVCLAQESAPKSTLENLQAAYNGESNAKVRYEAFARKADEEGYLGVGSLFRAAATAEGIHLTKHAGIIKQLGAEPQADLQEPEVKSTQENLATALKGETYEREVMYPEFIKQAELEQNSQAARSFKGASAAEAEHAKLYQNALENSDSWKLPKDFLVCIICGFTTADLGTKQCPICSAPRSKFVDVK